MKFLKLFIASIAPEKNVICGYAAGLLCAIVIHFAVLANFNVGPTESASIGAASTGLIAHLFDTIVKMVQQPEAPSTVAVAATIVPSVSPPINPPITNPPSG
jgi:hypothetical protein